MRFGLTFTITALSLFLLMIPGWWLRAGALFLLSIIASSWLLSMAAKRFLRYSRSSETLYSYRYQPEMITIEIYNPTLVPIFDLFLVDQSGGLFPLEQNKLTFNLGPRKKVVFRYLIEPRVRGRYTIGPVLIKGTDPLGLFPFKRTVPIFQSVIVYPALAHFTGSLHTGTISGSTVSSLALLDDPTRYRGIRPYSAGDDPRKIHWKLSARMNALYTKDQLTAFSRPVLIVLNLAFFHYPPRYRESLLEHAVEAAAGFAHDQIQAGQRIGLFACGEDSEGTLGESIPLGGGYGHGIALLETLALIQFTQKDFSDMHLLPPSLSPGTHILYIGPELAKSRQDDLVRLLPGRFPLFHHYITHQNLVEGTE